MENIDKLIVIRLGEHQRKTDFINASLIKKKHNNPLLRINYIVASVAASIAIIFAVSPALFHRNSDADFPISAPVFTEYRGDGYHRIEQLINDGDYNDALLLIDENLNSIEAEIKDISYSTDTDKEEQTYLFSLYNVYKEELLWCKIYLLFKLNDKKGLKESCNNYLGNSTFIAHRDEVMKILQKFS